MLADGGEVQPLVKRAGARRAVADPGHRDARLASASAAPIAMPAATGMESPSMLIGPTITGSSASGVGKMDDVDVEVAAAGVRRPFRHVLTEDFERPDADGHQRAHVADERQHRVAPLERVRGRDRLPFLPEAAIQTADHLALAEQNDEPFLDVAREPREVVHLESCWR